MWKVKVRVGAAACSAQLSNTRAGVNRWLQVGHGECLHHWSRQVLRIRLACLLFSFLEESVVKPLPTLLWKEQKFSPLTTLILSYSFSCFPHAIWYVISWAESRSSWFLLNTGWSFHMSLGPRFTLKVQAEGKTNFIPTLAINFHLITPLLGVHLLSSLSTSCPILLTISRALALVNLASCPICAAHWSPWFWVCNSRSYDLPCLLELTRWLHPYGSHALWSSHDVTWHSSVELGVCLVSLKWGESLPAYGWPSWVIQLPPGSVSQDTCFRNPETPCKMSGQPWSCCSERPCEGATQS